MKKTTYSKKHVRQLISHEHFITNTNHFLYFTGARTLFLYMTSAHQQRDSWWNSTTLQLVFVNQIISFYNDSSVLEPAFKGLSHCFDVRTLIALRLIVSWQRNSLLYSKVTLQEMRFSPNLFSWYCTKTQWMYHFADSKSVYYHVIKIQLYKDM